MGGCERGRIILMFSIQLPLRALHHGPVLIGVHFDPDSCELCLVRNTQLRIRVCCTRPRLYSRPRAVYIDHPTLPLAAGCYNCWTLHHVHHLTSTRGRWRTLAELPGRWLRHPRGDFRAPVTRIIVHLRRHHPRVDGRSLSQQ